MSRLSISNSLMLCTATATVAFWPSDQALQSLVVAQLWINGTFRHWVVEQLPTFLLCGFGKWFVVVVVLTLDPQTRIHVGIHIRSKGRGSNPRVIGNPQVRPRSRSHLRLAIGSQCCRSHSRASRSNQRPCHCKAGPISLVVMKPFTSALEMDVSKRISECMSAPMVSMKVPGIPFCSSRCTAHCPNAPACRALPGTPMHLFLQVKQPWQFDQRTTRCK